MDEQKPEALEAERMLTEFGCTDISVIEQGEDTWLLSASVPGIAMIAFSDRCAHTPRDPVYLAGQIIADITRIRARSRKAAPTREEIVAKLAALMKEKRHEATSDQTPVGDHGGDGGGGAGEPAPVVDVGPARAPDGGGDSSGDGLRPDEGPTTLEAVEADIVPAPEAQPLDADSAPAEEPTPAPEALGGYASSFGAMVDQRRNEISSAINALARERIEVIEDAIRNADEAAINNRIMMGLASDEDRATSTRLGEMRRRVSQIQDHAGALQRSLRDWPAHELHLFDPNEEPWPT